MIYDLELIKLGKVYDNGTTAVSEFDLTVSKGEFIAFLGPSGCGKTTTLRMIAGFESISSGDMMIKGIRMNEVPAQRRPTSTIFQNYALFPHMTVRRNVAYGLNVKGLPRQEIDTKVERILALLGIEDIAERKPERLSGGQRQRIALARSLVVEPDILLLDEPLGALDANLRKAIQSELKLLQKNLGITFIFVTHAQSEALALSDRIVVMNQGRVEQISPPHQLYTRPNTPFVAQFVGRNTIFPGFVKGSAGEMTVAQTGAGTLLGKPNAKFNAGQNINLVVPAEAFQVVKAGEAAPSKLGGNRIDATISRCDIVGHVSHINVILSDERNITLEGHVEKFPPEDFAIGSKVVVSWNPEQATVIAAN